ncbi:MAG: hypothetical protein JNK04_05310, partial [Myxococcales bacterium]|nr:hypothetical protein [Myxococcales bacterium]
APGLFALAELELAPRVGNVPAAGVAPKKKKKRKTESAALPVTSPKETALPLTLTRLALGLSPIPLLGAFAGIGSAIVTPFSKSVGSGVLFWLALAATWGSFAWSLQRELASYAGATLEAPALRRVTVLAGIGAGAGPVFAILMRPWSVSASFGPTLAVVVAVAAAVVVLLTAPLAARRPLTATDAIDASEGEARDLPRVDALLEKLDALIGFPLALVARLFSRGEKGEPT